MWRHRNPTRTIHDSSDADFFSSLLKILVTAYNVYVSSFAVAVTCLALVRPRHSTHEGPEMLVVVVASLHVVFAIGMAVAWIGVIRTLRKRDAAQGMYHAGFLSVSDIRRAVVALQVYVPWWNRHYLSRIYAPF